MKINYMMDLYKSTLFVANTDLKYQEFAIITANNPNGMKRTAAFNHWLDCHFISYLRLQGLAHYWVFAGSIDLNHYEFSAIVDCSLNEAQHIARVFRQRAFYWHSRQCDLYATNNLALPYSSLGNIVQRWYNNAAAYDYMIKDYHYARFTA